MNQQLLVTPCDASPDAAIAAVASHDGPVLIDLDETLYLRNSTEDFIDSVRPGLPALILMRFMEFLKPWRFTGGEATRDVWRVRAISFFFPWALSSWRTRAPSLASQYTNQRLLAALKSRTTLPIIVTVGFNSLVTPLVAAMGMGHLRIISADSANFQSRRCGKLALALAALGEEDVHRALVVTDSMDDAPLLQVCARPLRTVWDEAKFAAALGHVYLPGEYISRIKRPGAKYIFRGIIQEDWAYWVLSSIGLAAFPALHIVGLALLAVSFWAIYEQGYVDNDFIASKLEDDPKLSATFDIVQVATPRFQPWVWALAAGAAAIYVLRWPGPFASLLFAKWICVLLGTSGWFWLYNRFDKSTRVWMYAVLQFARIAAFVAIVPVVPIGAVALGSATLARWVPYERYRRAGSDWSDGHSQSRVLLFFLVLTTGLIVSQGPALVLNGTAAALLVWMVFRARREIVGIFRSATRLDRHKRDSPP